MVLNIWSDIMNKLNEIGDGIKNFFLENSRHTILWLAIVLITMALFTIVYKALNKD